MNKSCDKDTYYRVGYSDKSYSESTHSIGVVNWIKNLFRDNSRSRNYEVPMMATKSPSFDARGITFVIYGASGGKIVEFRKYDPKIDSYSSGLYIIPDSENFSTELSQIITVECLKGE